MTIPPNSPERVRLSLTDLTARLQPGSINVGDLFATDESLVYIPLHDTVFNATMMAVSALTGGLLGGLAGLLEEKQDLKDTRDFANLARQQDFGVSLPERVKKRNGVVIPRASIHSIDLINKGQAFRITHTGGQFELGSDAAAANSLQLQSWLAGTLVGDRDTQQTALNLPPAVSVLGWLTDGSLPGKLAETDLERIPAEPGYLKSVWMNFDVQRYPSQQAVIHTVRRLPVAWGAAFYKHLEAIKAKKINQIRWGLAATALGALALILFFVFYASILLYAGIFIPFFSVPWVLLTNSKLNQIKRLMRILLPKA